jgi:hypothetical protein
MNVEDLFRAVEKAYRVSESTDLRHGAVDVARIVAPPARGNYYVPSRDCFRDGRKNLRLLVDHDIVVVAWGKPQCVIISLEEYERLTGRKPTPPEI